MTADTTSDNFHLSYDAEEDRLLVAIDVTGDQHYAMALTRRLAKLLLGALAQIQVNARADAVGKNQLLRDTVLTFEHAQAVAAAMSSGDTKLNQPKKPLLAPPRLIREIKLAPKEDGGGVIMSLDDKNRIMTIDMNRARAHSFMAGVLDMATGAAWDLPVIATWLERVADDDTAAAAPRVVH
jgi:hypothetical protein